MSSKRYEMKCEYCGDPYIAQRSNSRFCCNAHRAAASRDRKESINEIVNEVRSTKEGIKLKYVLKSYLAEIEEIHRKIYDTIEQHVK